MAQPALTLTIRRTGSTNFVEVPQNNTIIDVSEIAVDEALVRDISEAVARLGSPSPTRSAVPATAPGTVSGKSSPVRQDLQQIGELIFSCLLPQPAQTWIATAAPGDLYLRLDEHSVRVPWELCYDGHDFLATKFRVGRQVITSKHQIPGRRREHQEAHAFGIGSAFSLSGVQNYIGTFWTVQDEESLHFATSFYRSVVAGKSLGEALDTARHSLLQQTGGHELTWASYLLYGDPATKLLPEQEPGAPLRVLVIADPTESLPAAEREAEQLCELLEQVGGIEVKLLGGRGVQRVQLLLDLQAHDVVHFAGHSFYDPNQPGKSGWRLRDAVLTAEEIGGLPQRPLLVFSNSCQAAATTEWGSRAEGAVAPSWWDWVRERKAWVGSGALLVMLLTVALWLFWPTAPVHVEVRKWQPGNVKEHYTILRQGDSMSGQDHFALVLTPTRDTYVYSFYRTAVGKLEVLFPRPDEESPSDNPVPAGTTIQVPPQSGSQVQENEGQEGFSGRRLCGEKGQEEFVIAASSQSDAELDALVAGLFAEEGDPCQKEKGSVREQVTPNALESILAKRKGAEVWVYRLMFRHE